MRLTEENVLKIVGMHLNKTNRTSISVAQLESLSKGLSVTLGVTGNKQKRFVKTQIVDFVNGFLKKKKRNKFIETELGEFGNSLPFLEIRYKPFREFFNDYTEEFINYYSYYYSVGQYKKEDFVMGWGLSFEDPESIKLNIPVYLMEDTPDIYIKHEDMKTILKKRFPPTYHRELKILTKKVYNRSRTHGFFKPSEVNKYANRIVEQFIKK
jgi:hypothetical protein